MLLASPWRIRPGLSTSNLQTIPAHSVLFISSVSKVPFLQTVSSSIVWSLILFGRYYPSVVIYNATVASNARVRCNPIFAKLGRVDSYNFFLASLRSVVFSFFALSVPAKLQYLSRLLSIGARKCERCWQSLVSSPTYLGALDFLKFDIFRCKIQRNRCGRNFRDWRTSGCTLKTRFADKLRKIFRKNARLWEMWRLLLRRAFIIHSHYAFFRVAANFSKKKTKKKWSIFFFSRHAGYIHG